MRRGLPILRIDEHNLDLNMLKKATEVILSGGIVIYPTDTVYGVGGNPFDPIVVKKIFSIKKRDETKGLPILAADLKYVRKIAVLTTNCLKLVNVFWPGALTIILKKTDKLPGIVTGGRDTVAVRIPGHKVTLELCKLSTGVLIGTSANLSGFPNPLTVDDAIKQIGDKVDLAIDSGPAKMGKPSTIIDMSNDEIKVIREGAIPVERIKEVLGF
ncbi:MAG: L-threonylcarbamoyladenylate synthase [Candidatus Odinarchaeia archaeon]